MRFFNTAGPVKSNKHYCLSPLDRLKLEELSSLIDQEKYFVLHAPRQTGKTTSLLALMEHLNQGDQYRCLYFNVECGQTARGDVGRGMRAIVGELATMARDSLQDSYLDQHWLTILHDYGGERALNESLTRWAQVSPKPLVLLIDEIDALVGDTLISVLRQLRSGYAKRPTQFPQSIILCGVRDVRDYRIHSDQEKTIITGGSAFNIKAESLRLGNFTATEIEQLYAQHTHETGQPFEPKALTEVWELTRGQPWLVNALGYEVCFKMTEMTDRTKPITAQMMQDAKERLIERRETHLDQLVDKLTEERVKRVIEPLLAGELDPNTIPPDDIKYVEDLGLIQTKGQLRIANRIYQEVIPRELTYSTQLTISQQPAWYIHPSTGRLEMNKLMAAFQEFFRYHSQHWLERFNYKEAGPQLLMQAFLQRIVNGGGRVEREYGLGRQRTDLLVVWPYPGGVQKCVIELKLLYRTLEKTLTAGVSQTVEYMDICGTSEGHLVIFDRSPRKSWEEKLFHREETHQGVSIQVWGM